MTKKSDVYTVKITVHIPVDVSSTASIVAASEAGDVILAFAQDAGYAIKTAAMGRVALPAALEPPAAPADDGAPEPIPPILDRTAEAAPE